MQPKKQETFFLDNDLKNLAEARNKIRNFFKEIVSPKELMQIVQSTDEALTNIMEHGLAKKPKEKIKVDLKLFEKEIQIVLTDNGPNFNPLQYPKVNPLKNYNLGIDGGIGIYIFKHFMKTSYEALKPQGNRLTLSKEI